MRGFGSADIRRSLVDLFIVSGLKLKCRHGLPAPIMAEDEFVEVDLELIAAHAVIGSNQPLLQVADGAACQGNHGFGAFSKVSSQGLALRQLVVARLSQIR
jgi:hypothetical protein